MPDCGLVADLASLIFGKAGLKRFVREWNASEFRGRLAGLGTVRFECPEARAAPAVLCWDSAGNVTQGQQGPLAASFQATRVVWNEFFHGQRSASTLILAGRLRFEGRLRDIAPYSLAFNCLAIVARRAAHCTGR
jgi:hypothetical protein